MRVRPKLGVERGQEAASSGKIRDGRGLAAPLAAPLAARLERGAEQRAQHAQQERIRTLALWPLSPPASGVGQKSVSSAGANQGGRYGGEIGQASGANHSGWCSTRSERLVGSPARSCPGMRTRSGSAARNART